MRDATCESDSQSRHRGGCLEPAACVHATCQLCLHPIPCAAHMQHTHSTARALVAEASAPQDQNAIRNHPTAWHTPGSCLHTAGRQSDGSLPAALRANRVARGSGVASVPSRQLRTAQNSTKIDLLARTRYRDLCSTRTIHWRPLQPTGGWHLQARRSRAQGCNAGSGPCRQTGRLPLCWCCARSL